MASLSTVQSGDPVNSTNINQFVDALNGQGNYPISLTAVNDGSLYALDVRNQDATNQRAFRVRNSSAEIQIDAAGGSVTINQVAISSGTITGSTITGATIKGSTFSWLAASSNTFTIPRVLLRHSTAQGISSGAATALVWDTEVYDTDGLHSTAAASSRIDIQTAGVYRLTAQVEWAANSSGLRVLQVLDSSGEAMGEDSRLSAGAARTTVQQVTTIVNASTTSQYRAVVLQNAATPLNVSSGAQAWFAAERIG